MRYVKNRHHFSVRLEAAAESQGRWRGDPATPLTLLCHGSRASSLPCDQSLWKIQGKSVSIVLFKDLCPFLVQGSSLVE